MQRLLLRVDGNPIIGLGHVTRCLSLSEYLRQKYHCIFILSDSTLLVEEQIKQSGYPVINIQRELNLEEEYNELCNLVSRSDILLLDAYKYDEAFQTRIKSKVKKLVQIDDFNDRYYVADLVINYSNSRNTMFNTASGTKVLAGFEYLLVRKSFIQPAHKKVDTSGDLKSLFLSMGGADPLNLTGKMLGQIVGTGIIKVINVVIGSAYKWKNELNDQVADISSCNINLYSNLTAEELKEVMASSDIAITPSSSIALELCCLQIPLITGYFVENHQWLHANLVQSGCAISLDEFKTSTIEDLVEALNLARNVDTRSDLIRNQSRFFDGKYPERISSAFESLLK